MLNMGQLSHLGSSPPSCFTGEGPKAQGAQVEFEKGPQAYAQRSLSLAAPHSVLRSPACDTCCPAPASKWGLALHRLGQTARDLGPAETLRCPGHRPFGRPGAACSRRAASGATSRSGGGAAAEFRSHRGWTERVCADASRRGFPIVPRAWAFHPAPPGRFPPRADGATSRHGLGAWEMRGGCRVVGVSAASTVAAALPPPPEGRGRSARVARRVRHFQGWPPRPCPQKGRWAGVVLSASTSSSLR